MKKGKAEERGPSQMPAQAAGGAAGRNAVSSTVSRHRVVGTSGSLTGDAGAWRRNVLECEGGMGNLFVPAGEAIP